ncbi:MAG: undecaprenyl-diphosphate phosphatase [Candidatus Omnitrophica bacterium]|nr:undecaprenyl-diphosphate phosphatase [Candidatus Omnitrophota bacterium]
MNIFIAIALGFLQGILEWIPVSSQGIISLFLNSQGYSFVRALDVALFLHAGTMLSVIVYFRNDFKKMLKPKSSDDLNLLYFMICATFFSLLIGGPAYLFLKSSNLNISGINVFIGLMLFVTGALQIIRKNFNVKKKDNDANASDGSFVGVSQGFSVIPGISRSGITIFALLLKGFSPQQAIRLSFIISVPVVFIESFYQLIFQGFAFELTYLVAAAIAFIVGIATIGFFIKLVKKIDFSIFCFAIGFLSIISAIF